MVLLLVNNISSKLFSPEFYTESISEQDAYNRIYDEVLVDHIFQGTTQELLGNIEVVSHTEVVALAKQIIPPQYLKQQIEDNILLSTQYMNGEVEELDLYFDMAEPLDNIKPVLVAYITERIDGTATVQPNPNADLLRQTDGMILLLNQGMVELSQGRLPRSIPSIRFVPVPLRASLFDLLISDFVGSRSLDSRSRQALKTNQAHLRSKFISGDTHGFLKIVAGAVATPLMDDASAKIRSGLDSQQRLDLISVLAKSSAEVTEASLRADAKEARNNVLKWMSLAKRISLTVLIGSSITLGLIYLPNPINMLRRPGITLLLVGISTYITVRIIQSAFPNHLGDLIVRAAADSHRIPSSIVELATDLIITFGQRFTGGVASQAINMMLVGGSLIIASLLIQHKARIRWIVVATNRRISKTHRADSSTVPTL